MSSLSGVGTPITFSDEDNPITAWIEDMRKKHDAQRRAPSNDAERRLLARWLGYRGRDELEMVVGAGCYAYAHFGSELDSEWRRLLADHIGTESGHGWGYIQQANVIDPSRDHGEPDPEFVEEYGLEPRTDHWLLQTRDFLSYMISGNLWPYGHCTSATIQGILVTTADVVDFEETVVEAEEKGHHDAMLQKIHDYVWSLIERYGEEPVRRRIAEIDAAAVVARSRTLWDPPRREFLRAHLGASVENGQKFFEWRRYLYESVLGFSPEPVVIPGWPEDLPVQMPAA